MTVAGWVGTLAAFSSGVLVVVGTADVAAPPGRAADRVAAFSDCHAFTSRMRELAATGAEAAVEQWDLGGGTTMLAGLGAGPPPAAEGPLGADVGVAVGAGESGTNVAEPGVDEPDVVKVAGRRVVALHQGVGGPLLRIFDTGADSIRARGALGLGPGRWRMLLLPENRVLAIGSDKSHWPGLSEGQKTPVTILQIIDIADPDRPSVKRTEKLTGGYVSARVADGALRVVVSSPPRIRYPVLRSGTPPELAVARAREAARTASTRDLLPAREIRAGDGRVVAAGPLLACESIRAAANPLNSDVVSVLTVNTRPGGGGFDRAEAVGVLGGGDTVYVSAGRLYLAGAEDALGRPPQDFPRARRGARTRIHAFDISGRGAARYVGSGDVTGVLAGPSGMSERGGILRVAATRPIRWRAWGDPASLTGVFTLAERRGRLEQVGALTDLAPGEEIKAVRWFADTAVLVTFPQGKTVDPLHVVDLTDPAAPQESGELRVPGFSGYLHPVGDDRLLGVGYGTNARGQRTELEVSLFDVRDPLAPVRLDLLRYARGTSARVTSNPRAFAYLPARGLAVLPVVTGIFSYCDVRGAAYGVAFGPDGRLRRAGEFAGGRKVLRVVPVGDRLVALTAAAAVLLDPAGLRPIGSAPLALARDAGELPPHPSCAP